MARSTLRLCHAFAALLCWSVSARSSAEEDIEFVAEHLPEVAMDNRYASLPLWSPGNAEHDAPALQLQTAYARTTTGGLQIEGPLLSLAISSGERDSWRWGVVAFYDPLNLKADSDERPLQTLFAPETPIARPVAARFTNLDGRAIDYGAGVFLAHPGDNSWLGQYVWTVGVLWQRMELHDYRLAYQVIEGPQSGVTGEIAFDAEYTHVAPLVSIEWPRKFGRWSLSTRALIVQPLPRRGVVGSINGPGFDLHGDTEEAGAGKHFGDLSLTLGMSLRYEPMHVSVDVGALVSQALLEPRIHRGIDTNYLLSFSWQY